MGVGKEDILEIETWGIVILTYPRLPKKQKLSLCGPGQANVDIQFLHCGSHQTAVDQNHFLFL